MDAPRWPLGQIKKLANAGAFVVMQRRAADFFDTMQAAREAVTKAVAALSALDFAHTLATQADEADVYGPRLADGQWYLKLTIQPATRLILNAPGGAFP